MNATIGIDEEICEFLDGEDTSDEWGNESFARDEEDNEDEDENEDGDFLDGKETSAEIGAAILELFPESAEEVWAYPTDEQVAQVVSRAWELAGDNEDRLCWGKHESFTRDEDESDENNEVCEFVPTTETSDEIRAAILELFPESAEKVLDDPTNNEIFRVVSRAWEIADDKTDTLYWNKRLTMMMTTKQRWSDWLTTEDAIRNYIKPCPSK